MARTPPTATASLRRWLAGWLVLALCAQALSAAGALARPSHRHAPAAQGQSHVQHLLLWRHAGDTRPAASLHDAHTRAHDEGQAHEHAVGDLSVLPGGSDAAADAAALAALFAAPPPRTRAPAASRLRHVWAGPARWVPTAPAIAPLRRPPRA